MRDGVQPWVALKPQGNITLYEMKTIGSYPRLVGLLLCLMAAGGLMAQRGRGGQKVVDVPMEIDSIRTLYTTYHLAEARQRVEVLQQYLARHRQETPEALQTLIQRLERAERMLPRVESLTVARSLVCDVSELNAALSTFMPRIGQTVRFVLQGDTLTSEYRSSLGNMGLLAEPRVPGGSLDLAQLELLSGPQGEVTETHFTETINSPDESENFPFMMPDGITLLFARQAHEGLGGYDLYISRYHLGREAYLDARPLGMPFNSPANDYLLAYDDQADETLLVSDRDCPEGRVRLYAFAGRPRVLASQVESSADMAITQDEAVARARLFVVDSLSGAEESRARMPQAKAGDRDGLWQYGLPTPRTPRGQALMQDAIRLYDRMAATLERQQRLRQSYRRSAQSRSELTPTLIALEAELSDLRARYHDAVKAVRNAEYHTAP